MEILQREMEKFEIKCDKIVIQKTEDKTLTATCEVTDKDSAKGLVDLHETELCGEVVQVDFPEVIAGVENQPIGQTAQHPPLEKKVETKEEEVKEVEVKKEEEKKVEEKKPEEKKKVEEEKPEVRLTEAEAAAVKMAEDEGFQVSHT